jgi:hypothetical protein
LENIAPGWCDKVARFNSPLSAARSLLKYATIVYIIR